MVVARIARESRLISVHNTEGDVFLFELGGDNSLVQAGLPAWGRSRIPLASTAVARIDEARIAAIAWLAGQRR